MPRHHLRTARMLGELKLEAGDRTGAVAALQGARSAFLTLVGEGLESAEVQDLVSEAGALFNLLAYLHVEQGDAGCAFAMLAEGKARLMNVALKQVTLSIPDQHRERFSRLRSEIRGLAREVASVSGEDGANAIQRLGLLRSELGRMLEANAPEGESAARAVSLAQAIVGSTGVVVAPLVTKVGGKLLIVSGGSSGVTDVDMPQLTTERLEELMQGPRQDAELGGWLAAYNKNYEIGVLEHELGDQPADGKPAIVLLRRWQALTREWLAAVAALGAELWRLVGAALVPEFDRLRIERGGRVVWMPTSSLGLLPVGLAQDSATGQRLGELYDICYALSLSGLSAGEQLAAAAEAPTLALVAPPNDLISTELETRLISRHVNAAGCTVLRGAKATQANVLTALRESNYWHFATHGFFDWSDARQSSLGLSDGGALTMDALLEAEGLRRPRLVTLSACETGFYEVRINADEFIGFPGAFIGLGAAGVLSSLWPVDDRATALLMAKFYDLHLGHGVAPASALRHAQLWLAGASAADLTAYVKEAAGGAGRRNGWRSWRA